MPFKSPLLAALFALATSADAQTLLPVSHAPNAVYEGVYDVRTGILTPPGQIPSRGGGKPVIYRNNTQSTFNGWSFLDMSTLQASPSTTVLIDEGRLPSTSSTGVVGTDDSYDISEFQIAYTTSMGDPSIGEPGAHIVVKFYEQFPDCTGAPTLLLSDVQAELLSLDLTGLPGSAIHQQQSAHVIDIVGFHVCMRADGNGTFGDADGDLFGWSIQFLEDENFPHGPMISGEMGSTPGEGTVFLNPTVDPALGLGTANAFGLVDGPTGFVSCFWFGGTPIGSFHLLLRSDLTGIGTQLCEGVPNSTGFPAPLCADGDEFALSSDVELHVSSLPQNSMGYFVTSKGAIVTLMNPGGSVGDLCIGSLVMGRYAGDVLSSGSVGAVSFAPDLSMTPTPAGSETVMAGDTRYWQYWYRDHDSMGNAVSNFSGAIGITFN